jgi:hypothetical protein
VETQLRPTTAKIQVPVRKLVEVPTFKVVEEEYTDYEEQERVRDKEIWVKQIVQEKYKETVPVTRFRQVRKPHKEIREVEELTEVEVPTNEAVQVPSYRVDEVQDVKVVEVEELEDMEWNANPTGEHTLVKTEEGPTIPQANPPRVMGVQKYNAHDSTINNLEIDSRQASMARYTRPASASYQRRSQYYDPHLDLSNHPRRVQQPSHHSYGGSRWSADEGLERTVQAENKYFQQQSRQQQQRRRPQSAQQQRGHDYHCGRPEVRQPSQPMLPLEEPANTNGDYGWTTQYQAQNNWFKQRSEDSAANQSAAGEYSSKRYLGSERQKDLQSKGQTKGRGIGISVKSTGTAHTASTGIMITNVNPRTPAAHAGLQERDVITVCQGNRVTTVEQLGSAIQSAAGGQITFKVNRGGRKHDIVVKPDSVDF